MAPANHHICTITSDPRLAASWRRAIEPLRATHTAFDSLMTALRRLAELDPVIVLFDPSTGDTSQGLVAARVRHRAPRADLLTLEVDDLRPRISARDRWAVAGLPFNIDLETLQSRLQATLESRERVARCGWTGISPQIRAASDLLLAAAASNVTVLIEGESGTGKELAARAVHRNSDRSAKPFLALNCSAFPETLLESELFGHEKGAFTDAFARKKGIFEAAEGGTIFLDEIGETSPAVQARLLRVLEEHQVRPIGATKSLPVDFRIVAATNRDLRQAVGMQGFRRDLYFRLAVIPLSLPPLRERPGDIPALIAHHLQGKSTLSERLSESALLRLIDYDWPGNIRELRNFVERADVRFPGLILDREMTDSLLDSARPSDNLPVISGRRAEHVEREMIFAALSELKRDLDYLKERVNHLSGDGRSHESISAHNPDFASMRDIERDRIILALRQSHDNRAQAAKLLGVGERTLYRKLKEYGLR